MADQPPAKPTIPPDDMHWVLFLREEIRVLREEIREIRQDQREIRQEMRGLEDRLQARIDSRFSLMLVTMVTLFGMTIGFIEYRLPAALG